MSMQRASKPEVVALVLLGLGLYNLALCLRAAQPGLLDTDLPGYVWPLGAVVIYAVVALFMAGANLRALLLLALCLLAHVLEALLMGLGFLVLAKQPGGLSATVLGQGLWAYPPATLLQVAFVVPFVYTLYANLHRESTADAIPLVLAPQTAADAPSSADTATGGDSE